MILSSVPVEEENQAQQDWDDQPEDSLYGLGGHARQPRKGPLVAGRKAAGRKVTSTVRMLAVHEEEKTRLCKIVTAGVISCSLLGIAVLASISLLQRYAAEKDTEIHGEEGPLLAVFSYAGAPTNAALAWLVMKLLSKEGLGSKPNNPSYFALPRGSSLRSFIPDGNIVKVWRPVWKSGTSLKVAAHGGVTSALRQFHNLGPPRLNDLAPPGPPRLEADAFLEIRKIDSKRKRLHSDQKSSVSSSSSVVLISHPHHLPYLLALAWHSGLRPLVLDPAVYSRVPWSQFGCDAFGYASSIQAGPALSREMAGLNAYSQFLEVDQHVQQLDSLGPLLAVANATLRFYRCAMATNVSNTNKSVEAELRMCIPNP